MRNDEIRQLLALSPDEVRQRAGDHLIVCADLDALHRHMAEALAAEIEAANRARRPLRLIVPVGPTGQYPILAQIVAQRGLSLAGCTLFFMDEYCDEQGQTVPPDHPLSFRGAVQRLFLDRLPAGCDLSPDALIFPDERNIDQLERLIADGGIDTCYGGIGIHGHVAFNEPEPGVHDSGPRRVRLNDFTVTINAVRAGVGGNLENFPRHAYTLGMRQILSARRIRLYCRNGSEFDWANTVLRLALFGTPGDDYPVTHMRAHPDYQIATDPHTLASPAHVL